MRLSPKSIQHFVHIMTGHTGITNIVSKDDIDECFVELGFNILVADYKECFRGHDEVLNSIHYKDESFKLENYVRIKLEGINCLKQLKDFSEKYIAYITPMYRDYNLKAGKDDKLLEIFNYLNEEFELDNYQVVKIEEDDEFRLYSLDGCIISYECYFKKSKIGQFIIINEYYEKCILKLKNNDYSGAITNAQSLLEQVLISVRNEINKSPNKGHSGNLNVLIKQVFKLLNIQYRLQGTNLKCYQNMEDGFNNLSDGLQFFRYSFSDAHSRLTTPTKRDALLAVNTSKTMANFIVEYYFEEYLTRQEETA